MRPPSLEPRLSAYATSLKNKWVSLDFILYELYEPYYWFNFNGTLMGKDCFELLRGQIVPN